METDACAGARALEPAQPVAVSAPDLTRPGVWRALFPPALKLMEHLEAQLDDPLWTFGGGTVLMLRLGHRQSRDIDLFVPDPQYLGYVNPRLSDAAEAVSANYEESAEFIKFFLPQGEIDIVVGTALTPHPYEVVPYAGRTLKIETSAEIIAKKMWHRGDQVTARDLFDLALVIQKEPKQLIRAAAFLKKHREPFLSQLRSRKNILAEMFNSIDALDFNPSFDDCVNEAECFLTSLK